MTQPIEVFRPCMGDIPAIEAFFEFVLTDTFERNGYFDLNELRDSEIKLKKEMLRLDLLSENPEHFFLGAKLEDGTIVGTIATGPANEDILKCTENAYQGIPEIGTLFIHPEYQKQGIASRLIQEIERYLLSKGHESYCLDSGYQLAQKTWTQEFGEPQYLIKDHWGEGADHMIWKVKIRSISI